MEVRIRPKSEDYLRTASWQQLYLLCEYWRSDLLFYKDEVRFLKDLMDKYFIWLVEDESINILRSLSNRLIRLDKDNKDMLEAISKHMTYSVDFIGKKSEVADQTLRDAQAKLEDRFSTFVKDFVTLKKDIFKTTKNVIEEERLKRLLVRPQ